MRPLLLLGLVLLVLATSICLADRSEVPVHKDLTNIPWRRTSDGWERHDQWELPPAQPISLMHPTVLASFQVLVSLTALVAWPAVAAQKSPPNDAMDAITTIHA